MESDDTQSNQLFLAFDRNYFQIYRYPSWQTLATVNFDEWNHYRIVYTATRMLIYVNGELKDTVTGTFNPRSFIRFSNAGLTTATNLIDNVSIRPYLPEANSNVIPEWTSDWTTHTPDGTQFIWNDSQF